MIKTLFILFSPQFGWERVFRAQRSVGYLLAVFLIPLLLLTGLAEGFGLVHWGKWQGVVPHLKRFSTGEMIIFELGQLVLSVGLVFLGAMLVKSLAATFHTRHTFKQAFNLIVHGLGPLFLLRILDMFTFVSPWMYWAVGILLSVYAVYHGVPSVMQPDPPQAFGLFFMTSLLLFFMTGLAVFLISWFLAGKFTRLDNAIAHLLNQPSTPMP
jgi:hypothetical protein